ncbi:MAG TPA: amidohydrolase family protein [Longimicrobium sp.]|nr:amidohydrolase family protein [Longimicrobium sp.]
MPLRTSPFRLALCTALSLAPSTLPSGPPQEAVVAFEHVNVLPMDREGVLRDQTVLVRGETIVQVGPAGTVDVPRGARRIAGGGAYLLPGLADMHAHPYDTDGFPSYLYHGVTTVAVMHGSPASLEWRRRVRSGEVVGPTVYTAGPTVNGYPAGNPLFVSVEAPEEARAVVREQRAAGYDFVKIYSMLNPGEYRAIVDEGRRQGIAVLGHLPWQVPLDEVLAGGQANVAHVEEYFNVDVADSAFATVAAWTSAGGVSVTANLFAYADYIRSIEDLPGVLRDPEMRFHSPAGLSEKLPSSNRSIRADPADFEAYLRRQQPRMRTLTRTLSDAGVLIMPGTDTETFGFPGESLHLELDELLLAGLTPYQALSAATRNPGVFIARSVPGAERFGTVTPGSRADLVLVEADPLQDLRNLRRIRGVMARGRWHPRGELQRMRDSIARRNQRLHPLVIELDSLVMKAADGPASVALFQRIRREFPDAVPVAELVVRGYGRHLYLRGDRPNAIRLRELAAELYSHSFSAANEVGRGYLFAGDTAAALRSFRRSLELSPHNQTVRIMVEKVEAAGQPLRVSPFGTYTFDPVPMRLRGRRGDVVMSATIADSAGTRVGRLRVGDTEVPLEEIAAGGDRLWLGATYEGEWMEMRLRVEGDAVSGRWNYGFANNGELRGAREPARAP